MWEDGYHDADATNRNVSPLPNFCARTPWMTFDRYTGNNGRGSMVESGCVEYHFNLVGDKYY